MVRFCYVSADFGIPVFGDKGASVHIQAMVDSLMALGHDVHIVAPQPGASPSKTTAKLHRPRTRLPTISEADVQRATQSDRIFKERRNLAIAQSVEALVLELGDAVPFDAVYERYSLWSASGLRAARTLSLPFILEVNAPLLLEQQDYRQLVLSEEAERIEAEVFGGADLIYAVSEEVRAYCIAKGAAPSRTAVLENGVDLARFNPSGPKAELPFAPGLPVIGFSGSLKPWHGLEDLAVAFHTLRKRGNACGLLLAGDGPMRGWIEGFAKGAGLEDSIHCAGWIKHEDMPAYVRAMSVATAPYPKLESFYFSPLKLFEYMACGRAVAASRIGQIAHVIADRRNGRLTEPGNPDALADVLAELIADQRQRQALGLAAFQSMQGHSWLDCAKRVVADILAMQTTAIRRHA
jgi:glycosyltransferase involved in cell wall biosynthesis